MAKSVIHLINTVGQFVNNDPEIGDLLKVMYAFLLNHALTSLVLMLKV